MLAKRATVVKDIYRAAQDDWFYGGAVLDCIAGSESGWDVTSDNGKGHIGLFQFNEAGWKDSGTSTAFEEGVKDVFLSAAVAAAYLNRQLARVVGTERVCLRRV